VWGAGEQVNVGCVGIGGKGASDVTGAAGAGGNIIALCDVGEEKGEEKGRGKGDILLFCCRNRVRVVEREH